MAAPTKFHLTAHARQRAGERDITQPLFIEVVTSHEKKKQQYRGSHGGFVYLFTKQIAGRELHIAAEVHKDDCCFVTGFWT